MLKLKTLKYGFKMKLELVNKDQSLGRGFLKEKDRDWLGNNNSLILISLELFVQKEI